MAFRASILYVDDDVNLLGTFRRLFWRDPVDVTTSSDPAQALDLLGSREFHVIAADYQMPGQNGVEFLAKARDVWPDALTFLITGLCDFDAAVSALNTGVFRFVSKPWNPEELRQGVLQAAEHVALRKENEWLTRLLQEKNLELNRMNQELERRVHERTQNVLDGLVAALDYRDTETQWHSRRVAVFSKGLAEVMGIRGESLRDIEWGALLHDIGKIGVRDQILLKPGKLDEKELEEMKTHSRLGYDLVRGIEFLKEAALIVLHHHERYDGTGYPSGLKGDEIVIGARIFSAVDTFDAMTSDRPYRKALPYEAAAAEIRRVNGTQLDPAVVEAFFHIEKSDWEEMRSRLTLPEKRTAGTSPGDPSRPSRPPVPRDHAASVVLPPVASLVLGGR